MNKERENEILEMFDGGLKPGAIAQEMGVSVTAIRGVLKKYDRPTAGPSATYDEDEIVQEYVSGVPTPVILSNHKITYAILYTILAKHEIPTRKVSEAIARTTRINTAVEMYVSGAKLWEIFNETGIAQPTLHAELHKRGVLLRRQSTGAGVSIDSLRREEDSNG